MGKASVEVVAEFRPFFFLETRKKGMYFLRDGLKLEPRPGDDRRYTTEEVLEVKRLPGILISMGRSTEPRD